MSRLICSSRNCFCRAVLAARFFTTRRERINAITNAITSMMPLAKLVIQYSIGEITPKYVCYDDFGDSPSIHPRMAI
ncbi:hypothetical protein [Advenella kashmirensis]|uniref:hypothetical protein n=1 Tax=Advenella kashmirensis TaxID=310575 RepID=UPI0012DE608B|nr:hypothetical protein [Advenella kashmirensis]